MADIKNRIAKRVAKEINDGDVINLGIGLPTLVSNYLPEGVDVTVHSENGFIGLGPAAEPGKEDTYLTNAGAQYITVLPGAMFFDSAFSFGLVRGGHVDCTILGALEVDEKGNLANWIIPGKKVPGMGGAMDLVSGAKKVVVAMTHTAKGNPKILELCTLPFTAVGAIDLIVTEMCVLEVTPQGLLMIEKHPDYTVEEIQAVTKAKLIIADDLKVMED